MGSAKLGEHGATLSVSLRGHRCLQCHLFASTFGVPTQRPDDIQMGLTQQLLLQFPLPPCSSRVPGVPQDSLGLWASMLSPLPAQGTDGMENHEERQAALKAKVELQLSANATSSVSRHLCLQQWRGQDQASSLGNSTLLPDNLLTNCLLQAPKQRQCPLWQLSTKESRGRAALTV